MVVVWAIASPLVFRIEARDILSGLAWDLWRLEALRDKLVRDREPAVAGGGWSTDPSPRSGPGRGGLGDLAGA
jgi:hypothetical protein